MNDNKKNTVKKLTNKSVRLPRLEFESLIKVFQILKEIRDEHNASDNPSWITFDEYESSRDSKNE